jgi:hypothetical protein
LYGILAEAQRPQFRVYDTEGEQLAMITKTTTKDV